MTNRHAVEVADPEKFADFLVGYAHDPAQNITELARRCGLPEATARSIVRRLDGKYQPVTDEVRRITTDSLVKNIESKLPILLDAIDTDKVGNATLRDIAVAFGVLAEKRQLLKGEPTQILSYEERKNLNDLLPAIYKEAKRRDMPIDVEYHEIPSAVVSAPSTIQDAAVSKTAAEKDRRDRRAKNR